jgi:hypothetical protein
MYSKAKLVKNPRNKFGVNYVKIAPGSLQEGKYELWLKKENVRIAFNVLSGRHWAFSSDFILTERSIVQRTS